MANADWRKNLRYYRKKMGKTQADLAEHLNVRQQTYANYENGLTDPAIDDLVKITKYLGITITELFSNTDRTTQTASNPQAAVDSFDLTEHLKVLGAMYRDELRQVYMRLKRLESGMKKNGG